MIEWVVMKLKAQKREILGKKVKKLREQGKLPGVVFGKSLKESIPITLDKSEFEKVFEEAGESTLVDVVVEGQEPKKALVSEIAIDPVSSDILHASLHAVSLKDKITAQVPVKVVNESPIVKSGEGLLLTILDELEVECLPQNLPAEIEVDISNLTEINQTITIKDIKMDTEKIELKHEPDDVVLKIEHAEMLEEEEKEAEVPIEEAVEITTEKKKEDEEEEPKSKDQEAEAKKQS